MSCNHEGEGGRMPWAGEKGGGSANYMVVSFSLIIHGLFKRWVSLVL